MITNIKKYQKKMNKIKINQNRVPTTIIKSSINKIKHIIIIINNIIIRIRIMGNL
jgi:hypothetical protein